MKIAIFGGSFNPPHAGHVAAAEAAVRCLQPDKLLIVPSGRPPHKQFLASDPSPELRAQMCRYAFAQVSCAEVSDLELRRDVLCYTVDTLREIKREYPDAELYLLMGTDMLESFTQWYAFEEILRLCTLAVFCRAEGESARLENVISTLRDEYNAAVIRIAHDPLESSSSELRPMLANREKPAVLHDAVYAEIIRTRCYDAKPELEWLRQQGYALLKPKRIPHVRGTEEEAVRLAKHWGADPFDAAEAAILHDITKKLTLNEQLILCEQYGIISDTAESGSEKLLHSKTGAALARDRFGVSENVYEAIRWHTTGKAGMSLLEKIIYMADYMEPNRDFEGVDKLRELAYSDLDAAMELGFEMSLEELRERGLEPHRNSVEALEDIKKRK